MGFGGPVIANSCWHLFGGSGSPQPSRKDKAWSEVQMVEHFLAKVARTQTETTRTGARLCQLFSLLPGRRRANPTTLISRWSSRPVLNLTSSSASRSS